jgi:hypothetical protein
MVNDFYVNNIEISLLKVRRFYNSMGEMEVPPMMAMVVSPWRVCFFSFVLSTNKKKEHKSYSNSFSVLFALMQKEPKKSSPARSSAGRAGQRT